MFKIMNAFIQRIQQSDETTKRFWLVVFSAVTMVVVVGLWAVYAKITLPTTTPIPDVSAQIENTDAKAPGFFSIFAAGLKIIYDKVQSLVSAQVAAKHDIVIENPDRNFVLEELPAVAPTKLKK